MTTAGLKRALGYFVRQAEIYVLCIIGGSFALAVYMQIINGNGIAQMFQSVPLVDLWISGVAVFTIDVSSYQYCYSMPVSFGCLRKHAFFGTLAMNILVIAQGLLFYFLSSVWFGSKEQTAGEKVTEGVLILSLFLLLESFAELIGIVAMRWGKIAYFIMIGATVLASMSFGVFVSLSGTYGVMGLLKEVLGGSFMQTARWLLLAVAVSIVIHAGSWRILKNFEVKM